MSYDFHGKSRFKNFELKVLSMKNESLSCVFHGRKKYLCSQHLFATKKILYQIVIFNKPKSL